MGKNDDLSKREMKYILFVEEEAEKVNKVFMLDSGEGRDLDDVETGWYVEDLSGWLIEPNQKVQFLVDRDNDKAHDNFDEEYVFVEWYKKGNGEIGVNFKKYTAYED